MAFRSQACSEVAAVVQALMMSERKAMMKRFGMILMMVSTSGLCLFVGGCGKPVGQGTETQKSVVEAKNGGSGDQGTATSSDAADGQVTLTLRGATTSSAGSGDGKLGGPEAVALPVGTAPGVEFGNGRTNTLERLLLPDGTVYIGEVSDGQLNGQGTVTDSKGTNQQGEWRNGLPYKVSGTWVAPDGTIEKGTWNRDGTKCGGMITWKDGREYAGNWEPVDNGVELPDGTGTMTWPDGRKYVGEFRRGEMDGPGQMTYPGGKVENGLWKQGKFVGAAQ